MKFPMIELALLLPLTALLRCGPAPEPAAAEEAAPPPVVVTEAPPVKHDAVVVVPEPLPMVPPEPEPATELPASEPDAAPVPDPAPELVTETVVVAVEETVETGETTQQPRLIIDEPNPTDMLLDKLERSAADLRDFVADLSYVKWDSVLGRNETRLGELIYQVKPDGTRRFAILLQRLIVSGRARDRSKHYIFDGSWLVEIDHDNKMFLKRQIVPPGRRFDPLKLGEGPFPLPVGQPRDEVRARFDVTLLKSPQDKMLAKQLASRAVDGLLLVPKPGSAQAGDFEQVELFYDRDTALPVGICLTETNGDRKTVILRDLRRNRGVDEAKLSIEEPDARAGWNVDITPWQE